MNKDLIAQDFEQTFTAWEKAISAFNDQTFNQVPFEGSWTPGQVSQHLFLANRGIAHVLNAEVDDADRASDAMIPQLKAIFLNFDNKMKSPDFIVPELKDYDRQEFLTAIKEIKANVAKAINDLDLNKICLAFKLPNMGHLTRLENIYFSIYHTQRHTRQLENCYQFLKLS